MLGGGERECLQHRLAECRSQMRSNSRALGLAWRSHIEKTGEKSCEIA